MPTTRSGLDPAVIVNANTKKEVRCMFNPYEYTLSKQNRYGMEETKGSNIPHLTFQQGGARTLSLKLLFDTSEEEGGAGFSDVREKTADLWMMMRIDVANANDTTGKGEPPHVFFRWARFEFEAVITKMTEKITYFAKDGTAERSVVDVTFRQVVDEEAYERQNPTSGGGVAPKTRIIRAGDRLDLMAWEEYGDSTKWRRIAQDNGILDPLRLPIGKTVSIPPLE
ncbi:MAG: peptidoglycan-binding protein [Chloroflexota bacterium]|nr:peptidoglycan-binding protein [Chloroflexota bacterium]